MLLLSFNFTYLITLQNIFFLQKLVIIDDPNSLNVFSENKHKTFKIFARDYGIMCTFIGIETLGKELTNNEAKFRRTLFLAQNANTTPEFIEKTINHLATVSLKKLKSEFLFASSTGDTLTIYKTVETINGYHVQNIGFWTESSGLSMNNNAGINKTCRNCLTGLQLAPLVREVKYWLTVDNETKPTVLNGLAGTLWTEFQLFLNFTTNATFKNKNGSKFVKTPTMLNELNNGYGDTILAPVRHINNIDSFDNFTFMQPIVNDQRVFIIRVTNSKVHWDDYFRPFSTIIWIVIIGLLSLTTVVIKLLLKIIKISSGVKRSYGVFLDVLGIYCLQGTYAPINYSALRLIYQCVNLSAAVLFSAYSGFLISSLTTETQTLPFRNFQEFYADGTYQLIVIRNSSRHEMFLQAKDGDILSKIRDSLLVDSAYQPKDNTESLEQVCMGNYAYLTNVRGIKRYGLTDAPCSVQIVPIASYDIFALPMSKKHAYTDCFKIVQTQIREAGVLNRIYAKSMFDNRLLADPSAKVETQYLSVSGSHVAFLFILFGLGCFLSAGLYLLEQGHRRYNIISIISTVIKK